MIEAAITSPERDAFEPKPLIVRLRKLEENKKRNYLCRHGRGGQRLDSGAALGGSDEGRASAEEEGRLHRCRGGRRRKQRRKDALKGERKKVELKIRRRRPVAFSSSTLSCASSSPSLLPSPRLSPSLQLSHSTFEIRTPLPSENPITDSRALRTSGSSSPRESSAAASLCDGTAQTLTAAPATDCRGRACARSCRQLPTWTSTRIGAGGAGAWRAGGDARPRSLCCPPSFPWAAAAAAVATETDASVRSLSRAIHSADAAGLIDDSARST